MLVNKLGYHLSNAIVKQITNRLCQETVADF